MNHHEYPDDSLVTQELRDSLADLTMPGSHRWPPSLAGAACTGGGGAPVSRGPALAVPSRVSRWYSA